MTATMASGIGKPVEAQEADDQDPAEARDIADAEVEIAADQRHGETGGDDGADRHVIEDVSEVADGREGARLGDREDRDHQAKRDEGAVGAEYPHRPGARPIRPRRDRREPPLMERALGDGREQLVVVFVVIPDTRPLGKWNPGRPRPARTQPSLGELD